MNFERGKEDIKKAIGIGLSSDPEPGRKFFVRFRIRESRAEFYPLQRMENEGRPIIATAVSTQVWKYNPYTFAPVTNVICLIDGIEGVFTAFRNDEENLWEILP